MILGRLAGPARMALCLLLYASQSICAPSTLVPNTNRVGYHIGDLYCINESYFSANLLHRTRSPPTIVGGKAFPEAKVQCTSMGQHLLFMYGDIYAVSAPSMYTYAWYTMVQPCYLGEWQNHDIRPKALTGVQRSNEKRSDSAAAANGEPAHCMNRGNKCAYTKLELSPLK